MIKAPKGFRTSIYLSAEALRLLKEVKERSGMQTNAAVVAVALREYVANRRELPIGFEKITLAGYFQDTKAFETRVFTGRWVIPLESPFDYGLCYYAMATSQRGKWVIVEWGPGVSDFADNDTRYITMYPSLENVLNSELPAEVRLRVKGTVKQVDWDI
jgi:hypothetical protein